MIFTLVTLILKEYIHVVVFVHVVINIFRKLHHYIDIDHVLCVYVTLIHVQHVKRIINYVMEINIFIHMKIQHVIH